MAKDKQQPSTVKPTEALYWKLLGVLFVVMLVFIHLLGRWEGDVRAGTIPYTPSARFQKAYHALLQAQSQAKTKSKPRRRRGSPLSRHFRPLAPKTSAERACQSDDDCVVTNLINGYCCPQLCRSSQVYTRAFAKRLRRYMTWCERRRCPRARCALPRKSTIARCRQKKCVGVEVPYAEAQKENEKKRRAELLKKLNQKTLIGLLGTSEKKADHEFLGKGGIGGDSLGEALLLLPPRDALALTRRFAGKGFRITMHAWTTHHKGTKRTFTPAMRKGLASLLRFFVSRVAPDWKGRKHKRGVQFDCTRRRLALVLHGFPAQNIARARRLLSRKLQRICQKTWASGKKWNLAFHKQP